MRYLWLFALCSFFALSASAREKQPVIVKFDSISVEWRLPAKKPNAGQVDMVFLSNDYHQVEQLKVGQVYKMFSGSTIYVGNPGRNLRKLHAESLFSATGTYSLKIILTEDGKDEFCLTSPNKRGEVSSIGFWSPHLGEIPCHEMIVRRVGKDLTTEDKASVLREKQSVLVKGRILDSLRLDYLPSASITVKELNRTVIADEQGYYSIRVPKGCFTLEANWLESQYSSPNKVCVDKVERLTHDIKLHYNNVIRCPVNKKD